MDDCVRTKLAENENTVRDKKSISLEGKHDNFMGKWQNEKCFKLAWAQLKKKWTGTHTPSFLQNK